MVCVLRIRSISWGPASETGNTLTLTWHTSEKPATLSDLRRPPVTSAMMNSAIENMSPQCRLVVSVLFAAQQHKNYGWEETAAIEETQTKRRCFLPFLSVSVCLFFFCLLLFLPHVSVSSVRVSVSSFCFFCFYCLLFYSFFSVITRTKTSVNVLNHQERSRSWCSPRCKR